MSLIEAIVLGIVQGLTEFLPISSSAHQRIVPALLGWDDPGAAFTAVTQLGTEAAVLIFFRHEIWAIATHVAALAARPVAALAPGRADGLVPDRRHDPDRGPRARVPGRDRERRARPVADRDGADRLRRWSSGTPTGTAATSARSRELSTRDGILIGLAQSLALIPGVSRSGATMSAGLLLGLKRPAAAQLRVPAGDPGGGGERRCSSSRAIISGEEGGDEPFGYVALATVIAFLVGYAAIAWLLRYLAHHSVRLFVIYRLLLGSMVLILVAAGAISGRAGAASSGVRVRVRRPGSASSRRRMVRAARMVVAGQAEHPGPAQQVVGQRGDHRPGGVGGEVAGGEVRERLVFEVADGELDDGVLAVLGFDDARVARCGWS